MVRRATNLEIGLDPMARAVHHDSDAQTPGGVDISALNANLRQEEI
jgi:hypothetical protein